MSFNIHAAGSYGFRYTRKKCVDRDIFEAGKIMSKLRSLRPNGSSVAKGVASHMLPSLRSARMAGIGGIAKWQFVHLLNDGVTWLASHNKVHNGWIHVYARRSSTFWADSSGFARFRLHGTILSFDFMRTIMPVLIDTEMNHFGALHELSNAIYAYGQYISDVKIQPRLLIQLNA